ncbi:MAG: hypothetical protein WA004_15240 [Saprospiraceae bacterium]
MIYKILQIFTLVFLAAQWASADVYVVIYATFNGRTGHAGIAVDKYAVKVRDCRECPGAVAYDTVKTGNLLYYDLWPKEDQFDMQRLFEQIPATFFRLPASSAELPITVNTLLLKGIPHEEGYPCDALLKIKTTYEADKELEAFLNGFIDRQNSFNALTFNCADFVERAVEHLLCTEVNADEWVFPKTFATTPNKLYKELAALPEVIIIKNPGEKVAGSFWKERIIKR